MKRFVAIFALILIASLGHGEEKRFAVPVGGSPSAGPADAPVTMVEFLDFQ